MRHPGRWRDAPRGAIKTAMAFSLGFRRRDDASSATSKAVAALARETLCLGEDDAVTVSEISCGDPQCAGGAETIILVMRVGEKTRAAKISKAMALVQPADVAAALKEF